MNTTLFVFPHQLYEDHPGLNAKPDTVCFIEDSLFFGDKVYPAKFHKQKLWLHRSSMQRYATACGTERHVEYFAYAEYDDPLRAAFESGGKQQQTIATCDPTDFILRQRLERFCKRHGYHLQLFDNPNFLNTPETNREYRAGKKRWFMADFYKFQRRRLDLLMDGDEPAGGKWSFDADNRKKVPKSMLGSVPVIENANVDDTDIRAKSYVLDHFPDHPGTLDTLYYPTSHASASAWLDRFLVERFELFGVYEDAIVQGESWLWHSVLTPMLNIGLLTPRQIVDRTIAFSESHDIPLNSLEGFIRQVVGWREFMRATYDDLGVSMRNTNHWQHHRKIPDRFYTGRTGIEPLDDTIARVLKTGYCNHIERLMILGGFMFLCEFDPDDIYRWFMEMFVDSYDWVMVPNAYAMSQHADGGQITTKPYFSGSSYVRKMSNYKKGPWCDIWDGLYWRFIWNHSDELAKNPRWAMMCSMAKKMESSKMKKHLANANEFLDEL